MPADVPRTRWSRGVIGVAIVSMVAAFVTAFLWSRPASSSGGAWRSAPGESGAATREALLRASSQSGERAPVPESSFATSTSPAASVAATGVLRLRVFDAVTGDPVAHQACTVYSERSGNRVHARVRTDVEGRARVGGLPETTVLVHVPRSERFANATVGVWLRQGRTRDVDVPLGAGGTIVGRVVDDLGRALPDVRVSRVRPWPEDGADRPDASTEVRTDSEGRFEFARVLDVPRAVWIVDGGMRPERRDGVVLDVRLDGARTRVVANVKDAARVDVGDVVLERERRFAGRVLDARREPVANAWVQLGDRLGLRDVPVDPETWTGAHRARTAPDGSFAGSSRESSRTAYVISPIGALQEFPLPKLGPGERVDDLEFVLDDVSVVEIALHNADGRSVVTTRDATKSERVRLLPVGRRSIDGRLSIAQRRDDGVEMQRSIDAGRDGVFRWTVPLETRFARRVRFELPGYLPWDDVWNAPVSPLERRRYEVRALPTVRLHVRGPEQPAWVDVDGPNLIVHACLVDPKEYRRSGAMGTIECCGLGSSWSSPIAKFDEHVDLPVLADRPFWIHAHVLGRGRQSDGIVRTGLLFEEHYGPFSPDAVVHDVDIPLLPEPAPTEPRTPPAEETKADAKKSKLVVRVRAIDADGRTLTNSAVELRPAASRRGEWSSITADGRATLVGLVPGRHEMTVFAEGYRWSTPAWVEVLADRESDFGAVVLELLPEFRVRFVEADGSAPPAGTTVVAQASDSRRAALRGVLDAQGVLVARAESEERRTFQVREPRSPDRSQWRIQSVSVEPGLDTHEFEVRLLPWQTVEVVVSGAAVEIPEASLKLSLLEPVDTASPSASRSQIDAFRELMPLADGRRRYVVETYAGRFTVRGASALLRVPETTIEVRNSNDPQRFELSSTR